MKFTENSGDEVDERFVELLDDKDLTRWNFVYLQHNEDEAKSIGIFIVFNSVYILFNENSLVYLIQIIYF